MKDLVLFTLLTLASGAAGSSTAVVAFTQQDAPVIAWIEIDGNNRYSDSYIAGLIKTRPHQTFDSAVLDADLQRLVDSGLFDPKQTSVSSEDLGDGRVKIRFDVYEWRLISDVSFPGLDADQVATIQRRFREQSIHVALGEPCKFDELEKAQAVIAKYLKEEGVKSWAIFEAETDDRNATVRFVLKPEH